MYEAAYKLYYLNEYLVYNKSMYKHLEDEAAQEAYRKYIINFLEVAAELKTEIDKVETHLIELSNSITSEALENEIEKME